RRLSKAGVAQQLNRQVAPFRHATIFRRDRRLMNPLLKPAHVFIVALRNFFSDGVEIGLCRPDAWQGESRRADCGPFEKSSPVHNWNWMERFIRIGGARASRTRW